MDDYIKRLKQIQEEKSISVAQTAELLGFSEQFLIMLELGEIIPTEKQFEKIMEFVVNEATFSVKSGLTEQSEGKSVG